MGTHHIHQVETSHGHWNCFFHCDGTDNIRYASQGCLDEVQLRLLYNRIYRSDSSTGLPLLY